MKKIFILLSFFLLFTSCEEKITDSKHIKNIDMRIVKINSECSLTNDKFHNPQLCNIILLETINNIGGKKLYREINTCIDCCCGSDIHIDTKWLYNHKVGDTVHFDYLLRSKFFTIDI